MSLKGHLHPRGGRYGRRAAPRPLAHPRAGGGPQCARTRGPRGDAQEELQGAALGPAQARLQPRGPRRQRADGGGRGSGRGRGQPRPCRGRAVGRRARLPAAAADARPARRHGLAHARAVVSERQIETVREGNRRPAQGAGTKEGSEVQFPVSGRGQQDEGGGS